jgi:hypothetical protein
MKCPGPLVLQLNTDLLYQPNENKGKDDGSADGVLKG